MAEVTVANIQHDYWGTKRVMMADLTSIDNNDTWTTGMQKVDQVIIGPSAAGAGTQIGYTQSAGVITFKVESGTLAGQFTAIGT